MSFRFEDLLPPVSVPNVKSLEHEKLYEPLERDQFTTGARYLLPFGILEDSTPFKPATTVNGFVPWPGNSPFPQVLEAHIALGKLSLDGISTFFECGSAQGRTALAMSCFFNVVTVEALEGKQSKQEGLRHPIDWIEGNGVDELKKYLISNPDERLLILLDDHTPDHGCWIMEQLDVIKNYSNVKDHVIIVDDYNCFGVRNEFTATGEFTSYPGAKIVPAPPMGDYPYFWDFINKVREINPAYAIKDSSINPVADKAFIFICYVPN